MTNKLASLFLLLSVSCSARLWAQNIEGQIIAAQYGEFQVVGTQDETSTTGFTFPVGTCQVSGGGKNFSGFAVGVPLKIADANPALVEVVTPSAVNIDACTVTVTTAHNHQLPYFLTSGTGGLQEAINANGTGQGANTIVLNADWYARVAPSNPETVIASVTGNTNLGLVDVTQTPYVYYQWNGSQYASTGGGGSLPSAPAAGQSPVSTGPGTVYTAKDAFAPVLNASASDVSGSDIGARANTLFTKLLNAGQNGTVTIDPTASATYAQVTTVAIPLGDTLDCQGSTLQWAATTGQSIVYGGTFGGGTQSQQGVVRNCTLTGTGGGSTTIGVYAGGDPASVISPSTNYGNNLLLDNDVIHGFATGYTHGSNSYNNVIYRTQFLANTNDIVSASTSATNDGEATMVIASLISNAAQAGLAMNNVGDVYYLIGSNCDYNIAGCVAGTAANVELENVWEEQYFGPFINLTGSSVANLVKVIGGQGVTTAKTGTITNVAIDGADNLTLTTTTPNTGYLTGKTVNFSGLTTATFLNGTSGTIESFNGTTLVVSYTHAAYPSAPDTGTVTPANADLWHVEGTNSYINVHDVTMHLDASAGVTALIGLGPSTTNTVCVGSIFDQAGVSFTGTIGFPCQQGAPMTINVGATAASLSPTSYYKTSQQGYSIAWNAHLSGLTGEMDFVNTHGGGTGGMAWCDGAFNYSPSTCQMSLNTSGELFLPSGLSASELVVTDSSKGLVSTTAMPTAVTGPAFYPQSLTAGPNLNLFEDFTGFPNFATGSIGSPSGNGCAIVDTSGITDINHPGTLLVTSGTVASAGESCSLQYGFHGPVESLNTSPGWTMEHLVYVPVLPGTTAGSYQAGSANSPNANPWTTGVGFYLSSANGVPNDWYCEYGSTYTDTGIAATVAWNRLTVVSNGTTASWFINGAATSSGCTGVAVSSLPSTAQNPSSWTAVAGSTTSVVMDVDYTLFQRQLTR